MIKDSKMNEMAPHSKTYNLEKETDIKQWNAVQCNAYKSHLYLHKNHPENGMTFFFPFSGEVKEEVNLSRILKYE